MIIDSFLGFNEIELAKFRIEYLWELTDLVIIGESNLTHSGLEKPLFFSQWIDSMPRYHGKVRILKLELDKESGNWDREITSREMLQNHLRVEYQGSRAILSDLDEIPTRVQIQDFCQSRENMHFTTRTYYRKANFALRDSSHRNWNHGVMIYDHDTLPRNGGRYSSLPTLDSTEVGGHFSYLGMDNNSVAEKLKSFAHSELNQANNEKLDVIKFCDFFAIDHLGRFQSSGMGIFEVEELPQETDLLIELNEFNNSWFRHNTKTPLFIFRLFASAIVTHAMKDVWGSRSARRAIADFDDNKSWVFTARTAISLQILRRIQRSIEYSLIVFLSSNYRKVVNMGSVVKKRRKRMAKKKHKKLLKKTRIQRRNKK